jgi:Predicted redox protein, regulator of disulfide bond formation
MPFVEAARGTRYKAATQLQPGVAEMDFDKDLDARGLNCPLPILRTKKALADMSGGQVLRVLATDPGAVKDFQAFAKQTGNALLEHSEANNEFTFFMQKK